MLKSFTAGLLLITVSELGDKTFFIAALLAMRHNRWIVLSGSIAALSIMTILSVALGQVASLLPQHYIRYLEVALFLFFGLKLLYSASRMSAKAQEAEVEAAEATVNQFQFHPTRFGANLAIFMETFLLIFLGEWGDRTQIATITLAASNNPLGVAAGAVLGHAICAVIAVMGGSLIAGRISERTLTAIGGGLFLLFGVIALTEALTQA